MPAQFTYISQEDFHSFMESLFFELLPESVLPHHELEYALKWGDDEDYVLKVYSSIASGGEISRGHGKDAIRVVLLVNVPGKGYIPMWKGKRVHRVLNWQQNLYDRIEEGKKRGLFGRVWHCPKCGSPLIMRHGKRGPFFGCVTFRDTQCTGTREL